MSPRTGVRLKKINKTKSIKDYLDSNSASVLLGHVSFRKLFNLSRFFFGYQFKKW